MEAVLQDLPDLHALLPAKQAARYAGVTPAAILNWRDRGYTMADGTRAYLPCTRTPDGPRFTLLDVAKAEQATAKRARRR